MAYERNPDDPYRPNLADDEYRRQARLDNELQPDPEFAEGPASSAKVTMFAIAIAVAAAVGPAAAPALADRLMIALVALHTPSRPPYSPRADVRPTRCVGPCST